MLDVRGVCSGYGNIAVLSDVTFGLGRGEILGVLGRNGMGKSTLIRTLAGALLPKAGSITLNGADVTALPAHRRAASGITAVVQGRGIFPKLTVRENLEMGRIASGRTKRNRTDEVLGYFPRLRERLSQLAGTMSGGEQQMLAMARALMSRPKLLLLDEPSMGLSPIMTAEIGKIIQQINTLDVSIILVEQNAMLALTLAQYGYVLETGSIVMHGKARELLQDEGVKKAYLGI
jgi:branched-chain amino acid transport system ATP-binding protein